MAKPILLWTGFVCLIIVDHPWVQNFFKGADDNNKNKRSFACMLKSLVPARVILEVTSKTWFFEMKGGFNPETFWLLLNPGD